MGDVTSRARNHPDNLGIPLPTPNRTCRELVKLVHRAKTNSSTRTHHGSMASDDFWRKPMDRGFHPPILFETINFSPFITCSFADRNLGGPAGAWRYDWLAGMGSSNNN